MENYFDKEFDLRYFEMNKNAEASPHRHVDTASGDCC